MSNTENAKYFSNPPPRVINTPFKPSIPPSLNDSEVTELAARQVQAHGATLAKAACLVTLTATLFAGSGLTETVQGAALLALHRACVVRWLESEGLGAQGLDNAVVGLQQAAETARYLGQLPD